MAERISNIFRILLKILVSFITFFIFLIGLSFLQDHRIYASLPLLTVSSLSYYVVIKDHSEDFWKQKINDEPLVENLFMITVYIFDLLVILFGIVIAAHMN